MKSIRKPAVAGSFYPADPARLREMVKNYLETAGQTSSAESETKVPKAVIVPHAGYVYSGQVAAYAYLRLACARDSITRVVLLGPTHHVPVEGLALSSAREFETPLGRIPLDREAMNTVRGLPKVQVLDAAHAQEHSLEVQLPFLQEVLSRFALVPVAVGGADPRDVALVLDAVWGGTETVLVISSDLSHFHDYETASRLDRTTTRAIELLQPDGIGRDQACGFRPVSGMLLAARDRGLKATTVALKNSGDVTGTSERVVGYGAYVFE